MKNLRHQVMGDRVLALGLILFIATLRLSADQIEMQNGDRYVGRILTFTNDTLVLQSELLGTIRLPRQRVALIFLGNSSPTNLGRLSAPTNQPFLVPPQTAKLGSEGSGALRQLPTSTNSIQQIEQQFLSNASPEAKQKFNSMVGALASGKLNVSDIRSEAASAASQLRTLKRELGDEAGSAIDGYLAILENFLRETPAPEHAVTNAAHSLKKGKNTPTKEED